MILLSFYLLLLLMSFSSCNNFNFNSVGKQNSIFLFNLRYPRDNPGFPQKMSAHSVQPFGRLYENYIRMF